MAWADMEYIAGLGLPEPSPGNLLLAQVIVEIFSGTTEEASDEDLISSRNLTRLAQAVSFQAVWLEDHPDAVTSMDVQGVSQDGLSAQYAHVNAHLLAPLAKRCIDRLSWKLQPLRIKAPRAVRSDRGNRDSAIRDDEFVWTPLHV